MLMQVSERILSSFQGKTIQDDISDKTGNWSHLEVRAVIRFLGAKNMTAFDIHYQIVEMFGEKAMSTQRVAKWCHSFQSGRQDVESRNMTGDSR
ncbi:histone-lysine N-methyltransferase SETMAR [Trichonephila clavipes]|nr:histone-lysine N-methyltransferase SETMAR [Trichonephila clavipes]